MTLWSQSNHGHADCGGAGRGACREELGSVRLNPPKHNGEETKQRQEARPEPGVRWLHRSLFNYTNTGKSPLFCLNNRFPRPQLCGWERINDPSERIQLHALRLTSLRALRDERDWVQRSGQSGGRCPVRGGGSAAASQRPERHPQLQRRVVAGHREGPQQESAHPGRHQPRRKRGRATRQQQARRTGRGSGSAAQRDGGPAAARHVSAVPAVVSPRGHPGVQGLLTSV